MTAAGLIVFSLAISAGMVRLDAAMKQKGNPTAPPEHWRVKIHGSDNHQHMIEHLGVGMGARSFQRFCVEDPDPFYEGMKADLYFQRYEKCWKILYYTIDRSDDHGTIAAN